MMGENPANHVFIDLNVERQGHLLGDLSRGDLRDVGVEIPSRRIRDGHDNLGLSQRNAWS
jgi:hypothetical protein